MYKNNVSQIERKEKDTSNPHYIPQYKHSPYQKSPILTLSLTMTTLITKTTLLFLSRVTKGKSVLSRHLVRTRRASISILIIIILVVETTIVLESLRFLGRRRGRLHKATKVSLLSRNTAYLGVHLRQLSK